MFRPDGGKAPNAPAVQGGDKLMSRAEFDGLNPTEKAEKMRAGFRLIDATGSTPPAKRPAPVAKTIPRKDFDKLSVTDKMTRMKAGFQLVD
jgi:hypothetical protein